MKRGRKYTSSGSFLEVDAISRESEQSLVSKTVNWGEKGASGWWQEKKISDMNV